MATQSINHAGLNYSPGRLNVNEAYGTIISNGYNPPSVGFSGAYVTLIASGTTNRYTDNSHGLFLGDISGMPEGAVIDSATFSWSPTAKSSGLGSPSFSAYYSPAIPTIFSLLNYERWDESAVLIGTKTYGSISTSSANDFSFSPTAITALQTAIDNGNTSFPISIVNSWEVAGSFGGSWSSGAETKIGGVSDSAFSVYDMEIEYHIQHNVTAGGTIRTSASIDPQIIYYRAVSGTIETGGRVLFSVQETQSIVKEYIYKVYDKTGAYVGSWLDVQGDPSFTQRINELGSAMDVSLARSPERRRPVTEAWLTESGEAILAEDGEDLLIVTNETVTFGENTDVDLGYRVDIYVFYGTNELWLTESGEVILTEDNEELYLGTGAPNGRRIFSGIVADYDATYGATESVSVRLVSYGWELSRSVYLDGTDTDISHLSVDPSDIFRDILDSYGGTITYTASSIDDTGTTVSYDYTLSSTAEAISKALELCPPDWYYYVGLGDNTLYLKEKSATPDHVFTLGKEIEQLSVSKSIEDLVNTVYFVGGDTGSGRLYKKYSDATSVSEWGDKAKTIIDLSVTTDTGAQIQSENFVIDRQKDPRYTSELVINSGVYDIESISAGQSVGFSNFNNFVDSLVLQIVALDYSRDSVRLTLDYELPQQRNRIEDIKRNQQRTAIDGIGSAPS